MSCAVNVAIVGAGMAGLSCAHRLKRAGLTPHLFEATAQPGGRVSSVQADLVISDDGAQFLTARSPALQQQLARWMASGVAAQWRPRLSTPPPDPWYVGVPHMRALAQDLAQGLCVRYRTEITGLERCGPKWRLCTQTDLINGLFDAVVVATPPAQAVQLLAVHASDWAEVLRGTPMLPCWALSFSSDALTVPWDAQVLADGPIAWWAREDSKPARAAMSGRAHWVVQGSADWSEQHFQHDALHVGQVLLAHFSQMVLGLSCVPGVHIHAVRRWSAARRAPQEPSWKDSLWCAKRGLGVCGDGLSHSRVEQAYVSGDQLAEKLLEFFTQPDRNSYDNKTGF